MSHPNPVVLTAALSVTALAGYGAYRALTATDGGALPHSPVTGPAELAETLPEFTLDDIDGAPVSIGSLAGQPLVINFWATWCAPCLREIPLLKTLQTTHPDIRVVGIAVDRPDAVRAFADEIGFNYPVLVGQGTAMDAASALGIEVFVLPSTVFTDASGATLGIHVGEIHAEHLENLTATLAALDDGRIDLAAARQQLAGLR